MKNIQYTTLLVIILFAAAQNCAVAQFDFSDPKTEKPEKTEIETPKKVSNAKLTPDTKSGTNGPKYGRTTTQSWQTGVKLKAVAKCTDMFIMIPVPMNWPEQKVTIHEDKATDNLAKVSRRNHPNGGLQLMVVKVNELNPGKSTAASLTVEVTRAEILPPDKESIAKLSIPPTTKLSTKEFEPFLKPSPKIESDKTAFRDLFKTITKDIESDWEKIEAIYKYVQNTITYDDGNKAVSGNSAAETMKLKRGDCKEMTAVFIAICRAGKIPARTVWVPEHCYVEFFMMDNEGNGYWFPCQVSGTYAFGGIPEMGPILQKGDNFTFKEFPKEKFRFVEREVICQSQVSPTYEFFSTPIVVNRSN